MGPVPREAYAMTHTAQQLSRQILEFGELKGIFLSELEEIDRRHADILHRFEYPDCLRDERSRLATQLAVMRRRRRVIKDWLKLNEPILDYMGTDNGKRLQNMVNNLVGIGRKVEERSDAIRRASERT